jgi:hypothetical protein
MQRNRTTNGGIDGFIAKERLVYLPLLLGTVVLIFKPYFLAPTYGDTEYHLLRAREILTNPIKGMFWDYLTFFPEGRAIWHQPLFHLSTAVLWKIGGVRFAHSIITVAQILLSVGIAIWFTKKYFGALAAIIAGILMLFPLRMDYLTTPLPSAYIVPLLLLTTHFILKKQLKWALISSLIAMWTHPVALIAFPILILLSDLRRYRYTILAALTWVFWVSYWIWFREETRTSIFSAFSFPSSSSIFGPIILPSGPFGTALNAHFLLFPLGILGIWMYKSHIVTRLIAWPLMSIIFAYILISDYPRISQYSALPLSVFSGCAVQKIYSNVGEKNRRNMAIGTLAAFSSSFLFFAPNIVTMETSADLTWWKSFKNYEFVNPIIVYTSQIDMQENCVTSYNVRDGERLAWMTGQNVCINILNGNESRTGKIISGVPSRYVIKLEQLPPDFLTKKSQEITISTALPFKPQMWKFRSLEEGHEYLVKNGFINGYEVMFLRDPAYVGIGATIVENRVDVFDSVEGANEIFDDWKRLVSMRPDIFQPINPQPRVGLHEVKVGDESLFYGVIIPADGEEKALLLYIFRDRNVISYLQTFGTYGKISPHEIFKYAQNVAWQIENSTFSF